MKKHIQILFISIFILTGCSSWLDVKPSDRITEEVTFSTVQGFQTALNGIYIELNHNSLYGRYLTHNFVEILARRYAINADSKDLYNLVQNSDYSTETVKSISTAIWTKAYSLIANINFILKNCEDRRYILDDENYAIIKGEALALRAMLHFDMLRLFGPTPNTKAAAAIPYYSEFTYNKSEIESFESVIAKVLSDLEASLDILRNVDPILRNGIDNSNSNDFFNFRNIRLNYYAVKAIQARALLYNGNKPEALLAAKEVIAVQESYFPFTTAEMVAESSENPDRIFSTEVLFALQSSARKSIATSFDGNTINSLYTSVNSVNWIFGSQVADYRFKAWFKDTKTYGGNDYFIFSKFDIGANSTLLLNQMIPLIRVSEMYYIAAECEPDYKVGLTHINKVKANRGVPNVTASSSALFLSRIDVEYIMEFWGEGQLFYYYKRRLKTSNNVYSPYDSYEYFTISQASYALPLPEGEIDFN